MHQWFLKGDIWHAFNLDAPTALCGEASITYGVDPIADFIPAGGTVHAACEAVAAAGAPFPAPSTAPAPEPEPETAVKPKRRAKRK